MKMPPLIGSCAARFGSRIRRWPGASSDRVLVAVLACLVPLLVGCGSEPEAEGRLVIPELLYRSGQDTLEWIEIRNDGPGPARLAGVRIEAVGYEFPAGTAALPTGHRLLLVNDAALFAARHPGVAVFSAFPGRLDDQGEEVSLDGAEGPDFTVRYEPWDPWPAGAGLAGSSLVWTGGDPERAASWAASRSAGGRPGAGEETAQDRGAWISEVRPADGAGFVEIVSASSQEIDLGGWLLADSLGSLRSHAFSAGTILPAHGRLVVWQSPGEGQLGWGDLLPSSVGGRLALFERDADGKATGAAHGLSWDGIAEGLSWGRIGPAGTEEAQGLVEPSPGEASLTRRVGLAYISEVCYHPATGQAEYVEIASLSDTTLHLGEASDTLRSWTLSGTGLRFRATDTLAPRGRMVLVSESDMTAAAFRTAASLDASVPVRTFPGKLSNEGEVLMLGRPLHPVATISGGLKWVPEAVDEASWLPVDPWPSSADGQGQCLERVSPELGGGDPAAWRAAAPSPGR